MKTRLTALVVYAALASLLRYLAGGLPGQMTALGSGAMPTDPESLLAQGKPLALSTVGMWELELLPSISDVLAGRILARKDEIRATASTLPKSQQGAALEVVRGIGPKKSKLLSKSLQLHPPGRQLSR